MSAARAGGAGALEEGAAEIRRARMVLALAAAIALGVAAAPGRGESFWRVGRTAGEVLGCLAGRAEGEVVLVACREVCAPIPWQLDERDESGELALPEGPEANPESPLGVIDANDEILWMADDAGRRMEAGEMPAGVKCAVEIEQRGEGDAGWVYGLAVPSPAPRSPVGYVEYDPERDRVAMARAVIGFGAPTPRYFALRDADGRVGPNLLDRLKVRAAARFLGVVPLGRDEDDIEWRFGAWHAGAIRVVRRERQWVRLGWGLRTPIFRSETEIYRDYVELPVRLRLNFPPTYFFRGIEVQAVVDFRGLDGWSARTHLGPVGKVGAVPARAADEINALAGDWLALEGPEVTLILRLRVGETLASLRRDLVYRENDDGEEPEDVAGEHPAIGFRLTEWGAVERGPHGFAALAYVLPVGYGVGRFGREDAAPFAVEVRALGMEADRGGL